MNDYQPYLKSLKSKIRWNWPLALISFWLNRSLHRGAAGPPWHRASENEGFLWGSTAHTGGPGEMEEELGSLSRVWGSPLSHAYSQSTQPHVVSQVSFCYVSLNRERLRIQIASVTEEGLCSKRVRTGQKCRNCSQRYTCS